MKRLRDTHLRQQQAIEEIQDIFHKRDFSNMQFDPLSQTYVQPESIAYRNEQDEVVFSQQDSKREQLDEQQPLQELDAEAEMNYINGEVNQSSPPPGKNNSGSNVTPAIPK